MPDWFREHLNKYVTREEDAQKKQQRLAWLVYLYVTEEFDRSLPHRMKNGVAMPYPPFMSDCNNFALRVRAQLGLGGNRSGWIHALRMSLENLSHETIRTMIFDEPKGDDAGYIKHCLERVKGPSYETEEKLHVL